MHDHLGPIWLFYFGWKLLFPGNGLFPFHLGSTFLEMVIPIGRLLAGFWGSILIKSPFELLIL